MKLIGLTTFAVLLLAVSASTWAVLIAGSNGYSNYRHQADVCHAYQILIKHGVPESQIITLAYDDIANSNSNPFKGKVFNKPNGQDVYAGCKIDYKGKDVTPKNFLAVLTGDSATTGGRKVLKSTATDNVFINFADHGATGLIAVINDYLYADQLNQALNTMNTKKMYNKLVFYLEACESGSMFTNLAKNINIYAATAANPSESSWAAYCPPNDIVNGTHIKSCLGDEFSVIWMEDSDAYDLTKRTLDNQFTQILKSVKLSHPQKYGTLTWLTDPLSNFHGNTKTVHPLLKPRLSRTISAGLLNSRKSTLISLKAVYEANRTAENLHAYEAELNSTIYFDRLFQRLDTILGHNSGFLQTKSVKLPQDLACLRSAVNSFETHCRKFNDYGLMYVKNLAHLCYTEKIPNIDNLLKSLCTQQN